MTPPDESLKENSEESTLLDLTERDFATPVKSIVIPTTRYDPIRAREEVRSIIAKGLIWLLSATIVIGFALFYFTDRYTDLKDLLTIIFPPLIAIIGTVLGFYFGAEASKPPDD
jgi:F0F1-type ATP synthase assembly protein I